MTNYTVLDTPIGAVLLVGRRDDIQRRTMITGLFLQGQRYEPAVSSDWVRDDAAFADATQQLGGYFSGELTAFELPLAPIGSEFQQRVWRALSNIGFGSTSTYGAVAEQVADRTRTRAVASAIGRNPIGIVVPCHRVIGANGSLTGYAGGLDRKRWLLDHEAAASGGQQCMIGVFPG